jgi:hypothetical protein
LNRLSSVERILVEVERYPESRRQILSKNDTAAEFNHAFCLEASGRNSEAAQRFNELALRLTASRSALDRRFSLAARAHADALSRSHSTTEPEKPEMPSSIVVACKQDVDATLEAKLARKILPLRVRPQSAMPSHFTDEISRVYLPLKNGFWRDIKAERFVDEVERHAHQYMSDVAQSWKESGLQSSFRDDLVNQIRTKQFDEFSAEWLLALPDGRNLSDEDLYGLLHAHLCGAGETTHLEYLELDGYKALRYIRELAHETQQNADPLVT